MDRADNRRLASGNSFAEALASPKESSRLLARLGRLLLSLVLAVFLAVAFVLPPCLLYALFARGIRDGQPAPFATAVSIVLLGVFFGVAGARTRRGRTSGKRLDG
jgi:uncharacterized RDD family membrane protein YckC